MENLEYNSFSFYQTKSILNKPLFSSRFFQKKPMTTQTRSIVLHILASLAFLSIPIITSPDLLSGQNLFTINPFLQNFIRYFLLLLYFFLNYYWLLPRLYFNQQKVVFAIVTIILFFIIFKVPDLFFPFDAHSLAHNNFDKKEPPKELFHFFEGGLFQFIFVFGLSYLMKINQHFEQVLYEKRLAEISYLKAQINPHFLFNTLNSLYALTLEKSDEAPKAVIKLSGIMRYVTTESSKDYVSLDHEINYIKDYIDLQKLRLSSSAKVDFSVNGDFNNKQIVPLVLIPFIENAFKYGINPDEDSLVKIKIDIFENELQMTVQNSKVNIDDMITHKSKQGLENTEKRLQVLYPNQHKINVIDNEKMYQVQLKLFLP